MAINKENYYAENKIIASVKKTLDDMLKDLEMSAPDNPDGYVVVRNNQPTIQTIQNNTVYFDIISKRRIGTQGISTRKDANGKWQDVSTWYEEIMIQVSAFKQRNPEKDDQDTLSSSDTIEYLQATINGEPGLGTTGITKKTYFPEWMRPIKSTDVRLLDFETDSGLKEKLPQFDFLIVVEQTLLKENPKIDTITGITERI